MNFRNSIQVILNHFYCNQTQLRNVGFFVLFILLNSCGVKRDIFSETIKDKNGRTKEKVELKSKAGFHRRITKNYEYDPINGNIVSFEYSYEVYVQSVVRKNLIYSLNRTSKYHQNKVIEKSKEKYTHKGSIIGKHICRVEGFYHKRKRLINFIWI
jgi:hypothetical protein